MQKLMLKPPRPLTLEETITVMGIGYESIFPTRMDCIHHLYIVLGCGYEWQGGRLVNKCWVEDHQEAYDRMERGEQPNFQPDGTSRFLRADCYPPCNGVVRANLWKIPDDAQPDYLQGAWEAVYFLSRFYPKEALEVSIELTHRFGLDPAVTACNQLYTCPCCGYLSFSEPPGSYDICPLCFWEDDSVQLRHPDSGGANIPLRQAQKNYAEYAAKRADRMEFVRPPIEGVDLRDPTWRMLQDGELLNPSIASSLEYFHAVCKEEGGAEELYYWRRKA